MAGSLGHIATASQVERRSLEQLHEGFTRMGIGRVLFGARLRWVTKPSSQPTWVDRLALRKTPSKATHHQGAHEWVNGY